MTMNHPEIRVGATDELSLRVSVGTLVQVIFKNPQNKEQYSSRKDLTGLTNNSLNLNPYMDGGESPSSTRADLSGLGLVYNTHKCRFLYTRKRSR
jgi:hypothetical protein